eukprot:393968-Pelagomonas_calceolata.AAC.2
MMIDNELQGSWDQPTRTIVMQNMDASRMQQLAMQFTDKAMVRIGGAACVHQSSLFTCAPGYLDSIVLHLCALPPHLSYAAWEKQG